MRTALRTHHGVARMEKASDRAGESRNRATATPPSLSLFFTFTTAVSRSRWVLGRKREALNENILGAEWVGETEIGKRKLEDKIGRHTYRGGKGKVFPSTSIER